MNRSRRYGERKSRSPLVVALVLISMMGPRKLDQERFQGHDLEQFPRRFRKPPGKAMNGLTVVKHAELYGCAYPLRFH